MLEGHGAETSSSPSADLESSWQPAVCAVTTAPPALSSCVDGGFARGAARQRGLSFRVIACKVMFPVAVALNSKDRFLLNIGWHVGESDFSFLMPYSLA